VDQPEIQSAPGAGGRARRETPPQQPPVVLMPVMAEDVAREQRRKTLIRVGIALAVIVAGAAIYKRTADPRNAREAFDAGLRLMKATRYEEAALNFSRAIDLKPDFAEAYRMRGRVYVAEYSPDPAIQDFSKLIELNPKDAGALVERGFARLDKKDYANAVSDADRAIAIDARLGRAYNLRATARRAAGDPARAVSDFTRAVELAPDLENYFQRASTYQQIDQHKLAVADFDNALYIDPQQPHIYFARALSKAALGDAAGAKRDIETGRKLDGW
jgi:tetratricopeptide (TPR) repeat protein